MPPDSCRAARIPSTPGRARACGPNPMIAGGRSRMERATALGSDNSSVQASACPVRITRNNISAVLRAALVGGGARSSPPGHGRHRPALAGGTIAPGTVPGESLSAPRPDRRVGLRLARTRCSRGFAERSRAPPPAMVLGYVGTARCRWPDLDLILRGERQERLDVLGKWAATWPALPTPGLTSVERGSSRASVTRITRPSSCPPAHHRRTRRPDPSE